MKTKMSTSMVPSFALFINHYGGVMINSEGRSSTPSHFKGRMGGRLTEAMRILLFIALLFIMREFAGAQYLQIGSKLVGTGAVGSAYQGRSVSLSADGNTAIVGGYADNNYAGAAWVYTRSGGVWTQQGGKLIGTGAVGSAYQGISVSLSADGNTAIVGGSGDNSAAGAAWVYTRSGGVWTQQGGKLVGTGAVGSAAQGISVSLSADGNTAIVGGYFDNSYAGAAWVYTRSGGVWTQQGGKLVGTGAVGSAYQGYSVSLSADGNTAIVGGYVDNSYAGAAWVYTRSGGVWTQQGGKLVGTGAVGSAYQGYSVSLSADGNTAIVGGYGDNSLAGAAWVYTRSGGVWTQQGTKLVGTGVVGSPYQGVSVSLSVDGNTAIVGGSGDNSLAGAAWMYVNGQPRIASVKDVPQDQGGDVFVNWNKSSGDVPQVATVTSYWVWRGVRSSATLQGAIVLNRDEYLRRIIEARMTKSNGSFGQGGTTPTSAAQTFMTIVTRGGASTFSGDIYWQYITSLPSHGLQHYSYASPTLADSTADGIPWRYFFITAATNAPDVYWDSPVDSGYSVDNLPPGAVTSIAAQVQAGPSVYVHWGRDIADPDVGYYELHRSTSSNFIPNSSTRIGRTIDTTLVDGSPVNGTVNYYRIVIVDIHGNRGAPSPQAAATVSETAQYTVADSWNMVSVPLTVSDYHKTALYPTGVSNAFAYQGGYVTQPILTNGKGYWVKFSGNQSVSMTGFVRTADSIDVVSGWNMIGSISSPVSVSTITSVPGGIVTSRFFGYNGTYQIASTIDPAQGYWVKANQAGRLYLGSTIASPQAGPIRIGSGTDAPPPPPDEAVSAQSGTIPKEFALGQNYPNPFNPSTTISYSLPVDAHVVLKLFDALGQEVMTVVDETQSAGYKSVTINGTDISSGVYCYRITAGTFIDIKKLILIR